MAGVAAGVVWACEFETGGTAVDVLGFAPEGGCAGLVVVAEDGADTAFWQLGRSFFSVPRVSFVYFISPFGPTVPGWPTRQVELSDVSRVLQLSIRICPPGQFSVTLSGIFCADAAATRERQRTVARTEMRRKKFKFSFLANDANSHGTRRTGTEGRVPLG